MSHNADHDWEQAKAVNLIVAVLHHEPVIVGHRRSLIESSNVKTRETAHVVDAREFLAGARTQSVSRCSALVWR